MLLWYINADFIANLSIPHKCCTPNDFHWVGGLKIRPLIITHPGINKSYCYIWSEYDGNKGAVECISVLDKHIKQSVPDSVKVLYLTVDNCSGLFNINWEICASNYTFASSWSYLYGS